MTHLSCWLLKKCFILVPRLNLTHNLPHKWFLNLCHHLRIVATHLAITPCQLTWKTIICLPLLLRIPTRIIGIVMPVVKLLTLRLRMKTWLCMFATMWCFFLWNPFLSALPTTRNNTVLKQVFTSLLHKAAWQSWRNWHKSIHSSVLNLKMWNNYHAMHAARLSLPHVPHWETL